MKSILIILSLVFSIAGFSQHDHSHAPKPAPKDTVKPKQPVSHAGHGQTAEVAHDDVGMQMSHAFSKSLPMTRNGSGTAWIPDNSPMYGYMFHSGDWMYMLHGNIFLRYNKQDLFDRGSRGDEKFDAPNMAMFMGQRNMGKKGLFHFTTMI